MFSEKRLKIEVYILTYKKEVDTFSYLLPFYSTLTCVDITRLFLGSKLIFISQLSNHNIIVIANIPIVIAAAISLGFALCA